MDNRIKTLWGIPELKKKILYTMALLLIFRLGCAIPVPFINAETLKGLFAVGNTFDYLNLMSGGAMSQCAILALGVTPYINASIIIQLMGVVIPSWGEARKDEEGRERLELYTKILSIVLGVILALGYLLILRQYGAMKYTSGFSGFFAGAVVVSSFVAGSQFVLWLGKKIDEVGIGNGVSLIIFAGIVARWSSFISMVNAALSGIRTGEWMAAINLVASIVLVLASIWLVVYVSGAERRIPVKYAGRVVGRTQRRGIGSFIPLKLMITGVLPVIFASTVLSIPQTIALFMSPEKHPSLYAALVGFNYTSWAYCVLYLILIFFFNYFYVSIQYDPVEMANNLRNSGGVIPGHRPGKPTSDYISRAMSQIAKTGSVALALIAISPIVVQNLFGLVLPLSGTALMIVVAVATEFVTTLDSYVTLRRHKGFLG